MYSPRTAYPNLLVIVRHLKEFHKAHQMILWASQNKTLNPNPPPTSLPTGCHGNRTNVKEERKKNRGEGDNVTLLCFELPGLKQISNICFKL